MVDVTPGVNAVITIPANNPTLYIKATAELSLKSENSSTIDEFSHTFATQPVSTSTSAQTKSFSLYWAEGTENSYVPETATAD